MKRLLWGIGVLLLASAVTTPTFASTNDFRFKSFEADYYLDIDSEGRSTLKTVEQLVAVFPDYDQNHGIERAIPKEYDGHSTSLKIESVTDEANVPLNYTTYTTNGTLVLRIGDKDTYVHGEQQYTITYTQRDVTKYFSDTNDDEFYWDTNGLLWPQPFESVAARVQVSHILQDKLTGQQNCVYGTSGSDAPCQIKASGDGIFAASTPRALQPFENMTIAIGFQPRTFTEYEPSLFERLFTIWVIVQGFAVVASTLITGWILIWFYRRYNRTKELSAVPPEYTPPKDISVTTAAKLLGSAAQSVMAAQLIDLAVRHYVKIHEVKEKSFFSPAEYEIEIIRSPKDLTWEEKELLSDTFGSLPSIGQRLNLKTLKNSTSYYKRTLNNDSDLTKLIRDEYGLRSKDQVLSARLKRVAAISLAISLLTISPALLVLPILAFALSFMTWPLTDKGLELKRYLLGLKDYVGLAEAQRLEALQSPQGVEKVGAGVGKDVKKRLVLYEKTLPYAILFGQEKAWNREIGAYYEQANTQPDWYNARSGVFHAAAFSSAVTNFSSATSYASSSSSSSGGTGGGSSGGGGGGGGGGGW